jgi:hypothetical protein
MIADLIELSDEDHTSGYIGAIDALFALHVHQLAADGLQGRWSTHRRCLLIQYGQETPPT